MGEFISRQQNRRPDSGVSLMNEKLLIRTAAMHAVGMNIDDRKVAGRIVLV
ncbi:MAG: hypothetical protein ACREIA_20890 [Opitutaceae bacterium]